MPIAAYVCPVTDEVVPIEDAEEYFEEQGVLPYEVIRSINRDKAERVGNPSLFPSPSLGSPEVVCLRELAIDRFLPYNLPPYALVERWEGTLWHRALEESGQGSELWRAEVWLPREEHKDLDGVKLCDDGKYRMEVLPGIFMRGRVDRVRHDGSVLIDHKSKRWPGWRNWKKKELGPKPDYPNDWHFQFNLSRLMLEWCEDAEVKEMFTWRMYRGAWGQGRWTFRKIPIPFMTKEELQEKAGDHLLLVQSSLHAFAAMDEERRKEAIENLPLDGEKTGWKCDYCSVRTKCHEIAGMLTF